MVFNKELLIKAVESMEGESFDLIALLNKYNPKGSALKENETKPIDCREAVSLISKLSGYTEQELKSKSRYRNLTEWRHVSWYLIYKYSSLTYQKTGDLFNTKHDNVIHGCKRVKNSIEGFNDDLLLKFKIAENVFKIQFNIL